MKYMAFIIGILAYSCTNNPKRSKWDSAVYPTWNIRDSTVQFRKYTATGLLDSTLQVWYHVRYGTADLHFNTLITRQYDTAGKLIEVKSFAFSDRSHKWSLESRNIKKYDSKGNLILDVLLDTKKSKSTISRMLKMTYNQENQEILRFEILQRIEPNPKDWNMDSLSAHHDDVIIPKYDTIIVSSSYDKGGNLVKEISSPGTPDENVVSTTYSAGLKKSRIGINTNGDTTFIYKYEKDGDLLRETIAYMKVTIEPTADTTWYKGDKVIKRVHYDHQSNVKMMEMYEYDASGNEIRNVNYN